MILKGNRESPGSRWDGTSDVWQNSLGAELMAQREIEIAIAGGVWYLIRVAAELEKVAFSASAIRDVAVRDPARRDKGQALDGEAVLPVKGFNECSFVNGWFSLQLDFSL